MTDEKYPVELSQTPSPDPDPDPPNSSNPPLHF